MQYSLKYVEIGRCQWSVISYLDSAKKFSGMLPIKSMLAGKDNLLVAKSK